MPYELFIALRYLRAKRRQAAVSVITAIAVIGITVGVAALIVAQAMVSGFRHSVQEKILQGTDHLNLLKEDNSGIENYLELAERIRQIPGVRAASATIYAPVLLSVGGELEQAVLKGVDVNVSEELSAIAIKGDPSSLKQPLKQADQTTDNHPEPDAKSEPTEGMILGEQLARALGVNLGDQVTAVSVATRLTPAGLQPRPRYTQFLIAGTFTSGWYQYDSKWAYIALSAAQKLTGNGDTAGVVRIQVADIYRVGEISQQVRSIAGPGFVTTDWQELNRPLFAALQLQHRVIIIFFALLIAIAALNIVVTLTMMVIEKHRDIAILRAQGATSKAVRLVFVLQGLIIGITGAGMGLLLGLSLCGIANHYRLISIPAEIYSISYITVQVRTLDCMWIVGLAILISLLATIFPASTAAKFSPVEILRYE